MLEFIEYQYSGRIVYGIEANNASGADNLGCLTTISGGGVYMFQPARGIAFYSSETLRTIADRLPELNGVKG
jgi:hypothetical protein